VEQALGFIANTGSEALLFSSVVVLDVVNTRSAEESILRLHTLGEA